MRGALSDDRPYRVQYQLFARLYESAVGMLNRECMDDEEFGFRA